MGISPVSCLAGLEGCSSESSAALAQSGVGAHRNSLIYFPSKSKLGWLRWGNALETKVWTAKPAHCETLLLAQSWLWCCSSSLCGSSSQIWCKVNGNFPVHSDGGFVSALNWWKISFPKAATHYQIHLIIQSCFQISWWRCLQFQGTSSRKFKVSVSSIDVWLCSAFRCWMHQPWLCLSWDVQINKIRGWNLCWP